MRPAGVVLAAGAGTRLRPLTCHRPKALCPVGGRLLVDLAVDRLAPHTGTGPEHVAVNAHHLAEQVVAHCAGRVHVSVEPGEALGTAGGLARLRGWLDGRDVLLTNADSYLPDGLDALVDGWDGTRCRLLCRPAGPGERPDFPLDAPTLRYVGACLLPWRLVEPLEERVSGLYEVLWRREALAGRLDLAVLPPGRTALDCGTPAEYLRADRHARARAGSARDGRPG